MYKLRSFVMVAALVLLSSPAYADTVFNFSGALDTDKANDKTGDYDHYGPLTGTLTLNSAGTGFSAVNLTDIFNAGSSAKGPEYYTITFTQVIQTIFKAGNVVEVNLLGSTGTSGVRYDFVQKLDIPTANLASYTGGQLCGVETYPECAGGLSSTGTILSGPRATNWGSTVLDSGNLSLANPPADPPPPPTITPEPASLMLLSTGVLGMAGVLRRRMLSGC